VATDTTTRPKDEWGLPKIDLGGGSGDENPRQPLRTVPISGSVITGQAFQTDGADPRIVIDSTQMNAHNSAGAQTFKLDVATGVISILGGSGAAPAIQFLSAANAVLSRIFQDTGAIYNASGLTEESIGDITIVAVPTIGAGLGGQFAELVLFSGVGSATLQAQSAAAARIAGVAITTATPARVSIQTTGLEAVDSVAGNLILSAQTLERHVMCMKAAFTTTIGGRFTAAGAGNTFGVMANYRQVRGDTNGGAVTPGAFTLTTVINNTNANTIAITQVRSEACLLSFNAVAAGLTQYLVSATAS